MSEVPQPPPERPVDPDEVKFEHLRDRTDEIELIISGLTTVALFTLPGWLFDTLMNVFSHQTVVMTMGMNIALILVPGLFYVLGFCFAIHLMIRAYWAGLIGLRTVFPRGINWDRTPGLGPVGQRFYQRNLPDLSQAIASADHLASSLFSVISLIALGMIWTSVLIGGVIAGAGLIGSQIGHTNLAITTAAVGMIVMLIGATAMLWLLDAKFGRWFPGLQERGWYRKLIHGLIHFNNVVSPQRLILPVQLTLQSNTRPRLFSFLLAAGIILIIVVGSAVFQRWTQFTSTEEFRYLNDDTVAQGFRSTYYEDLRSSRDRIRFYPMIDRFVQQEAVMTVFIPYYPLRDNLVLDKSCDPETPRLDCLRGLWEVSLGDRLLTPEELIPAQRFDLNLRGLMGVVPLAGLEPGRHTLELRWNAGGNATELDDRYEVEDLRYAIPFVFSPAYEIGLQPGNPAQPEDTGVSDSAEAIP